MSIIKPSWKILPYTFQILGFVILGVVMIASMWTAFAVSENPETATAKFAYVFVLLLVGFLMLVFSKEKKNRNLHPKYEVLPEYFRVIGVLLLALSYLPVSPAMIAAGSDRKEFYPAIILTGILLVIGYACAFLAKTSKPARRPSRGIGFLPNYYKKVAVGIFVSLFAIPTVLITLVNYKIISPTKSLIPNQGLFVSEATTWIFVIINISLFIFSISEEKEEDERITLIRLKSIFFAFGVGMVTTLIKPIQSLLFGGMQLSEMPRSEHFLILLMLISYLIYFNVSKRSE